MQNTSPVEAIDLKHDKPQLIVWYLASGNKIRHNIIVKLCILQISYPTVSRGCRHQFRKEPLDIFDTETARAATAVTDRPSSKPDVIYSACVLVFESDAKDSACPTRCRQASLTLPGSV